jgi:hypothetical protein
MEITIGANPVDELLMLLPLRLPFSRPLCLRSRDAAIQFQHGDTNKVADEGSVLTLTLTDTTVRAIVNTLRPRSGDYTVDGLETVRWHVEPSLIRDPSGRVIRIVG